MDRKKFVVVTGATSGLGQAAAIHFAKTGSHVFIVGRDAARAEETRAQATTAGGTADVVLGDISTRAGVEAVASAILAKTDVVDVLINNAGGTFPKPQPTAEGIDISLALNTVAAFRLERALHPALAKAKGRVVNLVTGFLNNFKITDPEALRTPTSSGFGQYGKVKLAGVMMTVEQAERLAAEGITAVALHPGVIMGTRFGGGQPKFAQVVGGAFMRLIGMGASLEEATRRFEVAAFGALPSGAYLVNGKPAALPKQAEDKALRTKVYAVLEQLAA